MFKVAISKFKNLSESEFDNTVLRYLTFAKFISLITYQALWFSKLSILQDEFEGTLPSATEKILTTENQKSKIFFNHPDLHKQIDNWTSKNVSDGRELTVVNCWFLGEQESKVMWNEYVGHTEGVAIKSTIRKLIQYIFAWPEFSSIGKVKYVDFGSHVMSSYEANQAGERAFLKNLKFQHEQEVRIETMSLKTPHCVHMEGAPMKEEDYAGKNMNNFENPGLYIGVDIQNLIDEIILAPGSPAWFDLLVKRIVKLLSMKCAVIHSALK
jgi:hypothetical protein